MTAFFRSEKEKQGPSQPVLGQEVIEKYGLVVQGSAPGLRAVGYKALCALGGHWAVAGWWNQLQEMGALQAPASLLFFPSDTEVLGVSEQGLCALHLLPLPPFLLGNRGLIRPAAYLPFLVPAEEEPAKPKLQMLGLGLCAGAAGVSDVELDGPCLPAQERCPPSSLSHCSGPRESGHEYHGSLLLWTGCVPAWGMPVLQGLKLAAGEPGSRGAREPGSQGPASQPQR